MSYYDFTTMAILMRDYKGITASQLEAVSKLAIGDKIQLEDGVWIEREA